MLWLDGSSDSYKMPQYSPKEGIIAEKDMKVVVSRPSEQRHGLKSTLCKNCGKEFASAKTAHRKYCCHKCYIADRFGVNSNGNVIKTTE